VQRARLAPAQQAQRIPRAAVAAARPQPLVAAVEVVAVALRLAVAEAQPVVAARETPPCPAHPS
jgi:hypothetical protein